MRPQARWYGDVARCVVGSATQRQPPFGGVVDLESVSAAMLPDVPSVTSATTLIQRADLKRANTPATMVRVFARLCRLLQTCVGAVRQYGTMPVKATPSAGPSAGPGYGRAPQKKDASIAAPVSEPKKDATATSIAAPSSDPN